MHSYPNKIFNHLFILALGFFFLIGFSKTKVQGQVDFGYPLIKNYSPEEYGSYVQNWGFVEDSLGMLYVANIGAVLEYDGVDWREISVDNNRSLSINKGVSGTIYVGGMGNLGVLDSPVNDTLVTKQYYSWNNKIPEQYRDFGIVRQILPHEQGVIFRTNSTLFDFNSDTLNVFSTDTRYQYLGTAFGNIYVNEINKGLLVFNSGSLEQAPDGEKLKGHGIHFMVPAGDGKMMIGMRPGGLYIYDGKHLTKMNTEADSYLKDHRLYCASLLKSKTIVIGTIYGGIVQIDRDGRVIRIIDENNGLQDNMVLSTYVDRLGSLWVALNNGISKIDFSLPIRHLDHRSNLAEMPISLALGNNNDELFVGTTDGLLRLALNDRSNSLIPIEELSGRCSDIEVAPEEVLAHCDTQLYMIRDQEVVKSDLTTSSDIIKVFNKNRDYLLFIESNSLGLAKRKRNDFQKIGNFNSINGNINSIVEDDKGSIWIGTTSNGLYKIKFNPSSQITPQTASITHFEVPHSDQKNRSIKAHIVDGRVRLSTSSGLFHLSEDGSTLAHDNMFGNYFADSTRQVYLVEEDAEGNVWFRSNGRHQVALKLSDSEYEIDELELTNQLSFKQANAILPDRKGNVWFATDQGLFQYIVDHSYQSDLDFHTQVREVLVKNDSLVNGGSNTRYFFPYKDNELRFIYSGIFFNAPEKTRYQVMLEGFDSDWSEWTTETTKDYTNIPEGNYTFKVRARNIHNKISRAGTFDFTVLPPWYRTFWAYGIYLFIIGGMLYGAHKVRVNRIFREQRIRNRIASDLHDDVSATLSSITYFAQAIRQMKSGEQTERFVELISESAAEAKEKITDIIWSIDPENDDWVNLLSKCRRFASDLLESKNMDYELDIDSDIDHPLDLVLRQHLWLIFKEMVVNAARHSDAQKVEVRLGMQDNILRLVVQDNGAGIEGELAKKSGHGIKNIQKRAKEIGAKLQLETDPEVGTRWIMTLKL